MADAGFVTIYKNIKIINNVYRASNIIAIIGRGAFIEEMLRCSICAGVGVGGALLAEFLLHLAQKLLERIVDGCRFFGNWCIGGLLVDLGTVWAASQVKDQGRKC